MENFLKKPLFLYNLPLLSDLKKTCCLNCANFGCGCLSGFGEEYKNVVLRQDEQQQTQPGGQKSLRH